MSLKEKIRSLLTNYKFRSGVAAVSVLNEGFFDIDRIRRFSYDQGVMKYEDDDFDYETFFKDYISHFERDTIDVFEKEYFNIDLMGFRHNKFDNGYRSEWFVKEKSVGDSFYEKPGAIVFKSYDDYSFVLLFSERDQEGYELGENIQKKISTAITSLDRLVQDMRDVS